MSLGDFARHRYVDARAALRRAARVCAYHDVALVRATLERGDEAEEDEEDLSALYAALDDEEDTVEPIRLEEAPQ